MAGAHVHDKRIIDILQGIDRDAAALAGALRVLRQLLDDGAGHPNAGELTPLETEHLARTLSMVGHAGADLLFSDLERTSAREGGRPH